MAFCNACGASLGPDAKFCSKCGASAPGAGAPPVSSAAGASAAPAPQGGSAVKVILIIVAVIAALGFLTLGGLVFVGWRMAHNSHIRNDHGNVRVDGPFGTVETTHDPKEAARNVGVDLYPGATVVGGGGANINFGPVHSSSAEFESGDPADVVAKFYQSKYPHAAFTEAQNGRYSITTNDHNNLTTIGIEARDGKTEIHIARVTRKESSGAGKD